MEFIFKDGQLWIQMCANFNVRCVLQLPFILHVIKFVVIFPHFLFYYFFSTIDLVWLLIFTIECFGYVFVSTDSLKNGK